MNLLFSVLFFVVVGVQQTQAGEVYFAPSLQPKSQLASLHGVPSSSIDVLPYGPAGFQYYLVNGHTLSTTSPALWRRACLQDALTREVQCSAKVEKSTDLISVKVSRGSGVDGDNTPTISFVNVFGRVEASILCPQYAARSHSETLCSTFDTCFEGYVPSTIASVAVTFSPTTTSQCHPLVSVHVEGITVSNNALNSTCEGNFLCRDGNGCFSYLKVCDGVEECSDGSDESFCSTWSVGGRGITASNSTFLAITPHNCIRGAIARAPLGALHISASFDGYNSQCHTYYSSLENTAEDTNSHETTLMMVVFSRVELSVCKDQVHCDGFTAVQSTPQCLCSINGVNYNPSDIQPKALVTTNRFDSFAFIEPFLHPLTRVKFRPALVMREGIIVKAYKIAVLGPRGYPSYVLRNITSALRSDTSLIWQLVTNVQEGYQANNASEQSTPMVATLKIRSAAPISRSQASALASFTLDTNSSTGYGGGVCNDWHQPNPTTLQCALPTFAFCNTTIQGNAKQPGIAAEAFFTSGNNLPSFFQNVEIFRGVNDSAELYRQSLIGLFIAGTAFFTVVALMYFSLSFSATDKLPRRNRKIFALTCISIAGCFAFGIWYQWTEPVEIESTPHSIYVVNYPSTPGCNAKGVASSVLKIVSSDRCHLVEGVPQVGALLYAKGMCRPDQVRIAIAEGFEECERKRFTAMCTGDCLDILLPQSLPYAVSTVFCSSMSLDGIAKELGIPTIPQDSIHTPTFYPLVPSAVYDHVALPLVANHLPTTEMCRTLPESSSHYFIERYHLAAQGKEKVCCIGGKALSNHFFSTPLPGFRLLLRGEWEDIWHSQEVEYAISMIFKGSVETRGFAFLAIAGAKTSLAVPPASDPVVEHAFKLVEDGDASVTSIIGSTVMLGAYFAGKTREIHFIARGQRAKWEESELKKHGIEIFDGATHSIIFQIYRSEDRLEPQLVVDGVTGYRLEFWRKCMPKGKHDENANELIVGAMASGEVGDLTFNKLLFSRRQLELRLRQTSTNALFAIMLFSLSFGLIIIAVVCISWAIFKAVRQTLNAKEAHFAASTGSLGNIPLSQVLMQATTASQSLTLYTTGWDFPLDAQKYYQYLGLFSFSFGFLGFSAQLVSAILLLLALAAFIGIIYVTLQEGDKFANGVACGWAFRKKTATQGFVHTMSTIKLPKRSWALFEFKLILNLKKNKTEILVKL